jgi:dolichol-phosphate mannosyltransferase
LQDKKISLIIPAFNEGKSIYLNLQEIKYSVSKFFSNVEIIVVDDGSRDNTAAQARQVNGVRVVSYSQNRGKGFALKYGFSKSTGEYITFLDADADIHPMLLKNFIPYLSSADMVIGSKRHPFSKLRYPMSRKVLSYMYHLFSWVVTGVKLNDTQSGMKIIKREVLEVIMPLVMVKRYAFDLELCFLAQKHGFRVVEAPLYINQKIKGSVASPATLRSIKGMFIDTIAIRYRYSVLKHYQKLFHKEKFKRRKTT